MNGPIEVFAAPACAAAMDCVRIWINVRPAVNFAAQGQQSACTDMHSTGYHAVRWTRACGLALGPLHVHVSFVCGCVTPVFKVLVATREC